jgi:hypothetical protein
VSPLEKDSELSLSSGTAETRIGVMQTEGLTLSWEDVTWEPKAPAHAMDRRRSLVVGRPYRAAVPAAIEPMKFDIEPDVAARAEDARAAITRFDAELSGMFSGEFAPLSAVLFEPSPPRPHRSRTSPSAPGPCPWPTSAWPSSDRTRSLSRRTSRR